MSKMHQNQAEDNVEELKLESEAELDISKAQEEPEESDDVRNTVIVGINVHLRFVEIAKTIMPHIDPSLDKRQAMVLVWDEKAANRLQKVLNSILNAKSNGIRIRHVTNPQLDSDNLIPHVVISSTDNIPVLFARELQDISSVKFAVFDNPSDIFIKLKLKPVIFPSDVRIILSYPKMKYDREVTDLLNKALKIVQPAVADKKPTPKEDGIKAYIVAEHHPEDKLKKAHCEAIQNLIVDRVLNIPSNDAGFMPSFVGYIYSKTKHCMAITCRNEETKHWLINEVNGVILPKFNKKLMVLDNLN